MIRCNETFFVSSVHKRKILTVGKSGEATTFASDQDGLFSVLGMSVDAQRRHLLGNHHRVPANGQLQQGRRRRHLRCSSLICGRTRLLKKYVLSNATKKHALGDLAVQANGDVFTTDSLSPAVYAHSSHTKTRSSCS